MKYSSDTIKPIFLNCITQCVLVYSQSLESSLLSNFRIFSSSPKEILYPSPLSPGIWQQVICFLSLCMCLFRTFGTSGLINMWSELFQLACFQGLSMCSMYHCFILFVPTGCCLLYTSDAADEERLV